MGHFIAIINSDTGEIRNADGSGSRLIAIDRNRLDNCERLACGHRRIDHTEKACLVKVSGDVGSIRCLCDGFYEDIE
jgi:hypothetical protein